jgi:mono/diheme cytochrome c family protein
MLSSTSGIGRPKKPELQYNLYFRGRMSKLFTFARALTLGVSGLAATLVFCVQEETSARQTDPQQAVGRPSPAPTSAVSSASDQRRLLDRYCVTCHNEKLKTAGLRLDQFDVSNPGAEPEIWENVVRKLRTGTMPPPSMPQPSKDDRHALVAWLQTELDEASAAKPNPGRTETLRRLNRTEYQNAIRDLIALEIDAASLLPPDDSGHGFDNVTVGDLPPTLLDRYISAAQKISRLAIGSTQSSLQADTIRLPADLTQEDHVPGLPIGTRGGTSVSYTFAQDGDYDIQMWLSRDLGGNVSGLREPRPHELILLVDREPVATFTIQRPADRDDTLLDKDLKKRVTVTAGPHDIGVAFVKEGSSLVETARQPLQSRFNDRRHPRNGPAINQVSVTGPYGPKGAENTPSRRRLFVCQPAGPDKDKEEGCAKTILTTLMKRAYRRAISNADIEGPMALYREGRADGDFDSGIGRALSAVLINPEFLFRVETDPKKVPAGGAYRITDLELASRLSFFLWSSIPDDELLDVAIRGKLSRPEELEKQTRRMLADRRSFNLATNFAGQWLRLRNLEAVTPNARLFPDFDDNLRQAFRQETELFIDSVLREDRSVLDLIRADYTFLNERLAKHYGIPNIYGSRFRRVALAPESGRGGLLRHGSVLSVTSYATRTSPVIRGVYVLDNIFGAPPPPPLPNVPSLDESVVSANLPMRERLAAHRSNAVCASCHRTIDPVGFALESFNAVGQWRNHEVDGTQIDASGALPGIGEFRGVAGLEEGLLSRPEMFAGTLTEKLLTFALGRGVDYYDAPAVRKIVREAGKDGYRFSSLILGIVKSVPFQMRRTATEFAPSAKSARWQGAGVGPLVASRKSQVDSRKSTVESR